MPESAYDMIMRWVGTLLFTLFTWLLAIYKVIFKKVGRAYEGSFPSISDE